MFSARSWPIQWAHVRLMGDTTQFAEVQKLLAMPNSLGGKHLTWVHLFTQHDTLFGVVEYLRPQLKIVKGVEGIYYEPVQFLVRIQSGLPFDWRHINIETQIDSLYVQPYNGITRRSGRWIMPVMNFFLKDFTKVPLEYEMVDAGVELCPARVPQGAYNRLPDEISKLPMPYSFSEYQYAGRFIVFTYVNRIIDTKSGGKFTLQSFAKKKTAIT